MTPGRFFGFALVAVAACLNSACSDLYCDPESSIACDDEDECTPAPSNCQRSAPALNTLRLELSNPLPVEVRVFRGANHESGILIWGGIPVASEWDMIQTAGVYSATALYVRSGDTTLVVNGGDLRSNSLETCDGTCYSSGILNMDLRLKD